MQRPIDKNEYHFERGDHDEVCRWIKDQSYLKDTIHESFDIWVSDHQKYKEALYKCEPMWSVMRHNDEIIGIYFATMLKNLWLVSMGAVLNTDHGLYDGFLVIKPEYRGNGLGDLLDKYKLTWTHDLQNWDYNWTGANENLLSFNIRLGYTHIKPRSSGIYLLWRYAEESNRCLSMRIGPEYLSGGV